MSNPFSECHRLIAQFGYPRTLTGVTEQPRFHKNPNAIIAFFIQDWA
jgi:hypothetical protein